MVYCSNSLSHFLYSFRANGKYSELLRGMADNDLMMHAHIDGIELLMFPSTILTADSQSEHHKFCIIDLILFHDKFVY